MLPAIEEVVKWYSLPSVPSHLISHLARACVVRMRSSSA